MKPNTNFSYTVLYIHHVIKYLAIWALSHILLRGAIRFTIKLCYFFLAERFQVSLVSLVVG